MFQLNLDRAQIKYLLDNLGISYNVRDNTERLFRKLEKEAELGHKE